MKPTYHATVKVMRSHDYCHFEINLGSTDPMDLAGVDALRKEAARLADKAVEQYKVAKESAQQCLARDANYARAAARAARIEAIPIADRSPDQQAELKAFQDALFHAGRRYDYEDDWIHDHDQWDDQEDHLDF